MRGSPIEIVSAVCRLMQRNGAARHPLRRTAKGIAADLRR
jgi:hypothetical protein